VNAPSFKRDRFNLNWISESTGNVLSSREVAMIKEKYRLSKLPPPEPKISAEWEAAFTKKHK